MAGSAVNCFAMRAIWKGSISFSLINIPIALYPASRREELKFRLLRASDLSPVNYKRVAEADGKEVPWDQIVKGYEYEKGKFVVLKEEDFARADIEATQTVEIINFVPLNEVNPLLVYKPYLDMAKKLIDRMSTKWEPKMFKDDYREVIEKIVDEKIHAGGKQTAAAPKRKQKSSNIIDLVSVLQESIKATQGKPRVAANK